MSNPLSILTDAELFESQLMIALVCNRSRAALRGRRRQYFCLLGRVLKTEADARGLSSPVAPYTAPAQKSLPPVI